MPVRLHPEPTNIKDAKAIAFECEIDEKKIGYDVKEVMDDVHEVVNKKIMCQFCLDQVHYRLDTFRPRIFCWNSHFQQWRLGV